MKQSALVAALVAVVAGISAFFIQGGSSSVREAAAACTGDYHTCLPDIEMVDTEGTAWTPESMAGKVVVINFWATWCNPCKAEIPDLARFYAKHEGEVILLGLMTDDVPEAALENFSRQTGLNYPVVRVDDELAHAFGYPEALPTTFMYDKSGKLVLERPGAVNQRMLERKLSNIE